MNTNKPRNKGIYLLPNLFTTSALFSGFYAIVAAQRSDFESAAIAIFVAMIMDGLDGRVARLTNTESAFGAEYDSLSDIVSFGVAPALVIYSWGLSSLGKPGWLVAFFFTAATALRLARFNSRLHVQDKKYFQGLPCPPAAGLIAALVWVIHDYGISGHRLGVVAAAITLITGGLMVSTIPYYSFKDIDLKNHVPFVAILALLLLFLAISVYPPLVLLIGFGLFALSGPFLGLRHLWKRKSPKGK